MSVDSTPTSSDVEHGDAGCNTEVRQRLRGGAARYGTLSAALVLALYLSWSVTSGRHPAAEILPAASRKLGEGQGNPTATFNTTMGDFVVELYLDRMPLTVSNFVDLCQTGFYDGLHFHRVIKDFMIQFGCPHSRDMSSQWIGRGGPDVKPFKNLASSQMEDRLDGGRIKDEFLTHDENLPGTLSMANTGQPDSGGSQFFINVANNSFLNWWTQDGGKHPVFGKVVENYALVKQISMVATDQQNRPNKDIMVKNCTVSGLPTDIVSS
mmetsp:Transcript_57597/g.106458  ORF Transcript_57597/g.106458 Transcript_57597/m.106458 type:complete len:267 (+) Transcript_57597:71-871(+)